MATLAPLPSAILAYFLTYCETSLSQATLGHMTLALECQFVLLVS